MTVPSKLNEHNHAEEPARVLLERLGWTYIPRDVLAEERGDQRDVLLKGRLKAALIRLNQWMTENQADRVIFELEHIGETGMARNQRGPRVPDLRHVPDRGHERAVVRLPPSASSTSNILRAASTSTSSPRSSGSAGATSGAA